MLLVVALVAAGDRTYVALRVFPPMQLSSNALGCGTVMLTAEIKGPETEEFYCPEVIWDELGSKEQSDCPVFEKRNECMEDQTGCGWQGFKLDPATGKYKDVVKECPCTIIGYPRRWSRTICAPPLDGGWYELHVTFRKNKKTIARTSVWFLIQ